MDEPQEGHLVARMERLERENRRLKRVALFAAVLLTAAVLLGPAASKSPPKVLKAAELQVVDGKGVARITMRVATNGDPRVTVTSVGGDAIELGLAESRPLLSLRGRNGEKAALEIGEDGAALALESADGARTTKLYAGDTPGVFIGDSSSGRRTASLALGEHGPSLSLVSPDEPGAPAIAVQVSSPFGPLLAVTHGLASASLNVSSEENASVTITDGKGRDRAVLGVTSLVVESRRKGRAAEKHETGPASLVLFNPDQTVVWKAP